MAAEYELHATEEQEGVDVPESGSQTLALTSSMGAGALLAAMSGASGGIVVPPPFSEPILIIEGAHVAGTTQVAGIREIAESLSVGDRLRLERDPANRYDSWCIRVIDGKGRRLGYLPTDVNEIPARMMDGGKCLHALVASIEQRDGWTRIGMDVYLDD